MAVTKIHPIKSTLKKALDYIENPDKTDEKLFVSSYGCSYETADIACFHASVKSSLISLFLLSPQNHRFCGVPQLPVFMSWATSAV